MGVGFRLSAKIWAHIEYCGEAEPEVDSMKYLRGSSRQKMALLTATGSV